jgi:imidazole glycerol-phosphate synthase subunit HisH
MENLRAFGLLDALNEAVLVLRKPVLGICLGMELMAETGEEGNTKGLGWLKARAIKFRVNDTMRHKVPHMGWNQIQIRKPSLMLEGIDDLAEFYFAHSYHLELSDDSDLVTETEYETCFPSGVEHGNIFGVQYHPEKSHDNGVKLLKSFVEL